MVKLRGPGIAAEASGSLGGVLVFSNSRGRSYAKKLTKPRQPRPPEQRSARAMLQFLTKEWSGLDGSAIVSWDDYPGLPDLDRYHRYVSANMTNWASGLSPSHAWPITRSDDTATFQTWSATPQGRRAYHDVYISPARNNWGIGMLRDVANHDTPHLKNCIWFIHAHLNIHYYVYDPPIEPGYYHYRLVTFSYAGKSLFSTGQRQVTIA